MGSTVLWCADVFQKTINPKKNKKKKEKKQSKCNSSISRSAGDTEPRWGCIRHGGGEGLAQSWGPSPGGSLSHLPSVAFGVPRYKTARCFPVPQVSPRPLPSFWVSQGGRCWGRGGLVLHGAHQHCTRRVGRDAISGLSGA